MRLEQFDYSLPAELIAQAPAEPRDAARLMVVSRGGAPLEHRIFRDLPTYLRPGDALVLNDTRVIHARLRAKKPTGGSVEVLLVRQRQEQTWEALVRPGRGLRPGSALRFAGGLSGTIQEMHPDGMRVITFTAPGAVQSLLDQIGEVPLPPYIHRPLRRPEDYQTVFATAEGAIAAPTAGLHFTTELLSLIRAQGVSVVTLTMHIGLGTFKPVTTEVVEHHRMGSELYSVSASAASAINAVRTEGGRIVAVGTSTVRTLETVANDDGTVRSGEGESDLFIYPGFRFKMTDMLVTNFHLPKTTLMLMVCAFAGRDRILSAYADATRLRYRFYSFGDAMLIL